LRLGGFARLFFFFLALRAADSFLLAKTQLGQLPLDKGVRGISEGLKRMDLI
jgi:hypothetical protein